MVDPLEGVIVELEADALAEVRARAEALGIETAELVRRWVVERRAAGQLARRSAGSGKAVAWGDYEQGIGDWRK